MGNPNTFEVKEKQMTFSSYFDSLPIYDKRDFVIKVMAKCDVSEATVYNWTINKFKPQRQLERPRGFDPFGHAGFDPAGKISLTL